MLGGALAPGGCKKEEVEAGGGTPALTNVTCTTNRTATSTAGNLADWIIVHGSNLCGVSKLSLNDVDVSLAAAYSTAPEITVQIPGVVPKNVTDTITVTTAGGTAQAAYTLSVPAMSVTSMANEYAVPDQRAAIVGSNFDLYEVTPAKGKVLWNGTALAIPKTTAHSVYFVVPASATLKVVAANGKETAVPGRYKDNRNSIFGYDTNGSVWGGSAFITNPGNYVLRFEANTLKVFNTNGIWLPIDGDVATNNTYTWVPTIPFTTRGQWSTMTVPLSGFINKKADLNRPLHACKFVFPGDGALDADISFDNFRIVPKG